MRFIPIISLSILVLLLTACSADTGSSVNASANLSQDQPHQDIPALPLTDSGLSLLVKLTGVVKMTLQQVLFITGSADAEKQQRIRSRHRIMVILRNRNQSRTWSLLTLFRSAFRNSIQHHRCSKCTLTIHIRLK